MGIVIETFVWEPSSSVFIFIFISCFLSLSLFPFYISKHAPTKSPPFSDHPSSSSPSLRFPIHFLFLYSLASVLEGLWSVYGEFELLYHGIGKEDTVTFLLIGFGVALFVGSFFGLISDLIGRKKMCLVFFILHLIVGIWKMIASSPSFCIANVCFSLATSIFAFSFETWAVVEHDKPGHRQDVLNETFWLMIFFESASLIGSQAIGNWMVGGNLEKGIGSPSIAATLLAIVGIICMYRDHDGTPKTMTFKDYRMSFYAFILGDRRILLLACAQACLHFSIAVFWILWAPTLVADGREVYLGLIYPCMLGARMLGSTVFPWLIDASFQTEDWLTYAFVTQAFLLSIIAYDYQDIGVLVTQFSLFHACIGLILPSLARLRTMYVPNELRGGMISLSMAPANAAILFLLMQRGYYRTIENSTMIALAAVGLFIAAGCMYVLKRCGKQPYQNRRKL
ncbi:prolyl 4-hydroxylase subunit alpha-1 [Hibiscus syriacus]|uniref:Prolyl 4-hydroxylase subunit alpha-1 n=1 Tax=Hibiscus syriacus TaxID=106335 RepID=A0A6A2Z3T2_HIBSY|nr:molybdate-anion transporter-like [Hibiscus syriacus]KAE8686040.1 prolyl 4-hydroxylase subunit alpha-1 [Hibiscus syriacus]